VTAPSRAATLRALTLGSLVSWGLIHVAGGISLAVAEVADGLRTLGPNTTDTVPSQPGETSAALLRFHAVNVALGGAAVLALAVAWWRQRSRWQVGTAIAVAVTLDVGLVVFLVLPGILPPGQGLIGPVLATAALAAAVASPHPRTAPS